MHPVTPRARRAGGTQTPTGGGVLAVTAAGARMPGLPGRFPLQLCEPCCPPPPPTPLHVHTHPAPRRLPLGPSPGAMAERRAGPGPHSLVRETPATQLGRRGVRPASLGPCDLCPQDLSVGTSAPRIPASRTRGSKAAAFPCPVRAICPPPTPRPWATQKPETHVRAMSRELTVVGGSGASAERRVRHAPHGQAPRGASGGGARVRVLPRCLRDMCPLITSDGQDAVWGGAGHRPPPSGLVWATGRGGPPTLQGRWRWRPGASAVGPQQCPPARVWRGPHGLASTSGPSPSVRWAGAAEFFLGDDAPSAAGVQAASPKPLKNGGEFRFECAAPRCLCTPRCKPQAPLGAVPGSPSPGSSSGPRGQRDACSSEQVHAAPRWWGWGARRKFMGTAGACARTLPRAPPRGRCWTRDTVAAK